MTREALTVFFLASAKLPEFFDYEPEIIREELKLSSLETEMVLACQNVFANNSAFCDWHIFENTVLVLNGREMNPLVMQEITPAEITWAVRCIRKLDPHSPFADEVLQYIAAIMYSDGLCDLPDVLKTEKGPSGLSCLYYLNSVNNHHEVTDAQRGMLSRIEEYSGSRAEKLAIELKENNVNDNS